MKKHFLISAILIICSVNLRAQYFGEVVMEKSFEQNKFFFRPVYVNPFGIGNFGSSLPGIADNPLLNLYINPASIVSDTLLNGYGYINFRNNRQKNSRGPYVMNFRSYTDYYIPYPWYWVESRRETEPIISLAYFSKLFSINNNPVIFGFTYQSIFIDEDFYEIPQGVYRSLVGYDFAGNKSAEISDMNVTDRYRGSDNMHQSGNFVSLFTGFSLTNKINLGFKGSAVIYNRNGKYENTYQWDNGMSDDNKSRNSYLNSRNQDYSHYDISAGIETKLSQKVSGGAVLGYLWGDIDQARNWANSSLYQNGTINQGTSWYYYFSDGKGIETWKHKGNTIYGGLNFTILSESGTKFNIFYKQERQNINIDLTGATTDTSYSNNHNESSDWTYSSEYISNLSDTRQGSGTWKGVLHHIGAGFIWPVDRRTTLGLGLHARFSTRTLSTEEQVIAGRFRQGYWESTNSENQWISAVNEDKLLEWEFSSKISSLQIPVFANYKITDKILLIFGVTRTMTSYKITDVTTAYLKYRTINENGKTDKKENFGERYTEPDEIRNTVSTNLLFGVRISPNKYFDVQLLMVPDYTQTYYSTELKEFQWWIDFNFYPFKGGKK
ncbi:hypothetical protein DRQ07_06040 [candidate division KSB1 bacterium]|nr:MAG: hypothetical protein DRQ07_06040 [candidate division KSB1 bacterium]